MSFSSVTVPFAHDFESVDFCVDVFNDNAFDRQLVVICLLLVSQWVIFTWFLPDSGLILRFSLDFT